MTQYIPTHSVWESICYDGTNAAAIEAAIAPVGTVLYDDTGTPHIFGGPPALAPEVSNYLGALHPNYLPWVLWVPPDPYNSSTIIYPPHLPQLLLRPWNYNQDGPAGWTEV